MIHFIKGDLFTTKSTVICHQTNTIPAMGSGVARLIREKFPTAYQDYMDTEPLLGSCLMSKVFINGVTGYIAHLYGQENCGNDGKRYTSYDALDTALADMYKQMLKKNLYQVSCPMLGAGLGGGNWSIIEAIIRANCPERIDTFIYKL